MNNEKINQMNKIKVTSPTFLINLDNPTEVSYEPKEGNWKSIIVSTYLYGFPEIKDNEILYVYKEKRGYIYSLKIEEIKWIKLKEVIVIYTNHLNQTNLQQSRI